jgi:hypothetical protein
MKILRESPIVEALEDRRSPRRIRAIGAGSAVTSGRARGFTAVSTVAVAAPATSD